MRESRGLPEEGTLKFGDKGWRNLSDRGAIWSGQVEGFTFRNHPPDGEQTERANPEQDEAEEVREEPDHLSRIQHKKI